MGKRGDNELRVGEKRKSNGESDRKGDREQQREQQGEVWARAGAGRSRQEQAGAKPRSAEWHDQLAD